MSLHISIVLVNKLSNYLLVFPCFFTASLNRKPCYTLKLWVDGSAADNLRENVSLQVKGGQEPASDAVIVTRDWTPHSRLLTLQFQVKEDLKAFDCVKIHLRCKSEREVKFFFGPVFWHILST